ncbi:MAG: hypothetical protein KAI70_08450 [Candidatus Omnitrophica bacterium]|nr:hypothetical protein [Candidatus Omnitrophota bacterium]
MDKRFDFGIMSPEKFKQLLTPCFGKIRLEIEECMRNAYGCNLFAIRKGIELPLELFNECEFPLARK